MLTLPRRPCQILFMESGLRVIGAGLSRTGTRSLALALERLLGARCYHMSTVFEREFADVPEWLGALDGRPIDWTELFAGCAASVDWPASAFWREQAERYPGALVVLSTRDDAQAWWRSVDATIWTVMRRTDYTELPSEWLAMCDGLTARVFGPRWDDPDSAMARYESWNAEVRRDCPPDRLLEWNPRQGWEPLCARLGVPVPADEFPRVNTTEDWLARAVERESNDE
jgi:hypothetical protein